MFENYDAKIEKNKQKEITGKVISKIKRLIEEGKGDMPHFETLGRIADIHPDFREDINDFLKNYTSDKSFGWKARQIMEKIEEHNMLDKASDEQEDSRTLSSEELIKSGLNKKESSFYKADERTQKKSVDNIVSNVFLTEKEEPRIDMIHLLHEISKNTPHESVKKSVLDGLNEIAMRESTFNSGREAALVYEKLVLKQEKEGVKLRDLSELHREIMSHPKIVSLLTREPEEITSRKIKKMEELGSSGSYKINNAAIEYLKSIQNKHPNYLIKRLAQDSLLNLQSRK